MLYLIMLFTSLKVFFHLIMLSSSLKDVFHLLFELLNDIN